MKYVFIIALLVIAGCKRVPADVEFEKYIKNNSKEISDVVEEFRESKYIKISYGSPDFMTLIDTKGEVSEVFIARKKNDKVGINEEVVVSAKRYREIFVSTQILSLEKSGAIYVEFVNGSILLISNGSPKKIEMLLHGKPSIEIRPGWHLSN